MAEIIYTEYDGQSKQESLWPAFALFGGLVAFLTIGAARAKEHNPKRRRNPVHPQALESLHRYKEDLKAGHSKAAEYWRGQAGAYFTANPRIRILCQCENQSHNKQCPNDAVYIIRTDYGAYKVCDRCVSHMPFRGQPEILNYKQLYQNPIQQTNPSTVVDSFYNRKEADALVKKLKARDIRARVHIKRDPNMTTYTVLRVIEKEEQNPITQQEISELVELYHLAKTAGAMTRYDRMVWAAKEFHKTHPDVSRTRAYIELDEATRMNPIRQTNQGWFWGSKGPFRTRDKALQVARAAYASGYKGRNPLTTFASALLTGTGVGLGFGAAKAITNGLGSQKRNPGRKLKHSVELHREYIAITKPISEMTIRELQVVRTETPSFDILEATEQELKRRGVIRTTIQDIVKKMTGGKIVGHDI